VKAKKQDMSIRELYRQKLGNAEIIPSVSVKSKLMRKLAIKEFMHFIPARINIYYLGSVLVAGIAAALIFSSGTDNSDKLTNLNISGELNKTDNTENTIITGKQTVFQKPVVLYEKASESRKNKSVTNPTIVTVKEPVQKNESPAKTIVNRTEVSESLTKNGLVAVSSADNNKLQGRFKSEELMFKSSVSEGCTPLKVHFYNKVSGYDSCRWTFGDGGFSDKKDAEWIFDVEGEYKVVLDVFGSNGVQTNSSTVITVYPKPIARFEISPAKNILPDDEIRFLNYSSNGVKYIWDFGDGSSSELFEPVHRYSKFANFNVGLVVTTEYGCSDSLIVLNAFSGSEYFINFPNAFIPNTEGPTGGLYSSKSDEAAEVFHPVFSGVSDYQLMIFSKLGILIFESNDINVGWDGYFKGQLSNPGVYIWKIRGNFRNGEPFIKMGDVTLLKN
jgi:PKD repeat protein